MSDGEQGSGYLRSTSLQHTIMYKFMPLVGSLTCQGVHLAIDSLDLRDAHIRSMHSTTSYSWSHPSIIMEIELHPAVSLLTDTFNVLVAPVEMLVEALNSYLELQHYKTLFTCRNYSRILSRLDRNITELEIRRAFMSFQLVTILLEEIHHSFLIVEHDPMLYEDAKEMVEYVAQALKQTSRGRPFCSTRLR